MSIWKKAISVGATAALLGSLFATALAPTVSAAAVMSPTTGPNTGGTVVSISGASGINTLATVNLDCAGAGFAASVTSVDPAGTALTFVTPDVSPYIGLCTVNADPDGAGPLLNLIGLSGFFAAGSAPGPVTLTPATGKAATVVTLSAPGQWIPSTGAFLNVGTVMDVTFIRNNGETATFAIPAGACPAAGGAIAISMDNLSGAGGTPILVGIPAFTCTSTTAKYSLAPTSGPTGTVAQVSYDPGYFDLACRVDLDISVGTDVVNIAPTSVAGDGSKFTFVIPSGTAAGTYAVLVHGCTGSLDAGAGNFTVTAAAGGGAVAPATVSSAGGTVVTVTGTGFTLNSRVYLDSASPTDAVFLGLPVVPTSVAADGKSLTFVMPSSASLGVASNSTVYVFASATGAAPAAATAATGSVTYAPPAGPPVVTSVSPNSGSRLGGNTVTITGSAFVSGATVAFGTTAATSVTFVSATSLTVVVPSGVGVVPVTVRNPDGQSGQLPGAYTYTETGYVCGAGTALGVTTTGPFGTSTKVAKLNGYVTYKFSCGTAAAGQTFTILGAKKNADGSWGAFTAVTKRIADSGGNVYYYVRSSSAAWWSFRMQIASSYSPARQARWVA